MPRARVLRGNELIIGGIRCRLFGVKLPKDIKIAASAERFLELYVKDYGRYHAFYNDTNPVSSSDGVPLVWFKVLVRAAGLRRRLFKPDCWMSTTAASRNSIFWFQGEHWKNLIGRNASKKL